MKMKSISLAAALALASTTALAQGNAATAGNDTNNSTTAGGAAVKNGTTGTTTGSSRPSPKDASTQGAGTAGAVDHFSRRNHEEVTSGKKERFPAGKIMQ